MTNEEIRLRRLLDTSDALEALAALALRFGEVERLTQHPDGRNETDTTHTVMLALAAVLVAPSMGLDPGECVIMALVHDLPEAYAGDTPTLVRLTPEQQADKDAAEAAATRRIRRELPLIGALISKYERQDTPAARMVKVLDKVMPKLTHMLDRCTVARKQGMTSDDLQEMQDQQAGHLRERYPERAMIPVHNLFDEMTARCMAAYPEDLG